MLIQHINYGRVAGVVLALLLVVPCATGALAYAFDAGFFPIQPRYYLLGIVALLAVYALVKHPRIDLCVLPLLVLIAVRIGDTFFLHRAPELDEADLLSTEGATLAYSLGVVFLCGERTALRQAALLCGSLTILACAATNAIEWQDPGFFGTKGARSAGMLMNANTSADAMVAMLGLVLSLTPPLWLAAGVICSSGLGIFFTLSRSGAICWLLIIVAYVFFVARGRLRHVVGFAFWLAMIIFVVVKIVSFENPVATRGGSLEAADIANRQRVLFGLETLDANDTHRIDVLLDGLAGVREQPLWGYGTGAAFGTLYRPHNELIALWLDNGIFGMMLYALGLCLLVGRCISRNKVLLIGCIPLVGLIPFSQNLAEDNSYLFTWIVLCGLLKAAASRWARGRRSGVGRNAAQHHWPNGGSSEVGATRWLPSPGPALPRGEQLIPEPRDGG